MFLEGRIKGLVWFVGISQGKELGKIRGLSNDGLGFWEVGERVL